ncbi:hypothetical protein ACS0TY_036296 [Phlomoides rotata]
MDPPVARYTSAGMNPSKTTNLRRHSSAPENLLPGMNLIVVDAVNDREYSTSPATMARLKGNFRAILLSITPAVKVGSLNGHSSTFSDSDYSSYLTEGITSKSEAKFITDEAIRELRRIADRIIQAGHSRECIRLYAAVRKAHMENSFTRLGIEDLSSKNVQRLEWHIQQEKIRRWIRNAKICFHVLFLNERRLAQQIFNGLGAQFDDDCFMETVRDHALMFFKFAESISTSRKSPEKLFRILDLYKVLSDSLHDIEKIFPSRSGELIRKKAVEILFRLSDSVRGILSEFEKAVVGEPTKALTSGGSIHPLTKCVMNFIDSMAEYKQTLIELIVSKPSSAHSEFEGDASPLVLHLVWIIEVLKINLKGKSKRYKDASLAHFFMMNNVHYIVRKIKGYVNLREMIGGDYLNKLIVEYNVAASNYLKSSWKKVSDCLRNDAKQNLGSFLSGSVLKYVLRQRFKAFNAKLKDVLRSQAAWSVPDVELREELRFSILQLIIPVFERHRSQIESGKHPQNYIRFSADDLEKAVMNLFECC